MRRRSHVRRASAGLSLTRLAALASLLAVTLALEYVASGSNFAVRSVDVEGASLTARDEVEAALLDGASAGNLFRFDAAAAEARLAELPAVRRATVRALLPDRLVVTLEERTAVLAIAVAGRDFLVDEEGTLFAGLPSGGAGALPRLSDERAASASLAVGSRLAAVDLRVARQLTALVPSALRSTASGFVVQVDDAAGFTLTREPAGWTAVFGLYGATARSPEIVALQVQCLASLMAARGEERVGRVVLDPDGQVCGTFGAP